MRSIGIEWEGNGYKKYVCEVFEINFKMNHTGKQWIKHISIDVKGNLFI